jgi:hypothetical protein
MIGNVAKGNAQGCSLRRFMMEKIVGGGDVPSGPVLASERMFFVFWH